MAIDSVSSATSTSTSTSTKKNDELSQDAFLQLLVAQMKNQDPTKPADSTEYLSQLAQFSTVSGVEKMQESIEALSESLRGSQVLSGTNLVGHNVLVDSDTATLYDTGSVYGATTVPTGASEVTLLVKDSAGQTVRQMQLSTSEGEIVFEWDGTDNIGERAAAGEYTMQAIANVGGTAEQIATQVYTAVGSVSIATDSSLTLNTDIGPISLTAVRQVM